MQIEYYKMFLKWNCDSFSLLDLPTLELDAKLDRFSVNHVHAMGQILV